MKKNTSSLLMLIINLFFILTANANDSLKVIFDEGIYWAESEEKVRKVIQRTKKAGFNAYIPCVWHGQGAIWPSEEIELWYKNKALAKQDPLKKFINISHEMDMKVIPCFTVMARQHTFYPEFATTDRPKLFNVHDDRFRELIVKTILEVIKKYDIDGINLDYIRAGQVCYEKMCRKKYHDFIGRHLMVDLAMYTKNENAKNRIIAWQREAVTSLVEEISDKAKNIKPNLLITVSAAPWADTVVVEGQDSVSWANSGHVDYILSMNYQENLPWDILYKVREKLFDSSKLVLMVSNYKEIDGLNQIKSKSGKEVLDIVKKAKDFNEQNSFSLYIYSMMTEEQVEFLNTITSNK